MTTILVVDDRPEARYVTVRTLRAAGYDVRETGTGRDALRLARLASDLIVLDVFLPDMDGLAVCRRLKNDPVTATIPVIHKTAVYGADEHNKRGLAAGADEYLTEPVEPALLLDTVARLLRTNPPVRSAAWEALAETVTQLGGGALVGGSSFELVDEAGAFGGRGTV